MSIQNDSAGSLQSELLHRRQCCRKFTGSASLRASLHMGAALQVDRQVGPEQPRLARPQPECPDQQDLADEVFILGLLGSAQDLREVDVRAALRAVRRWVRPGYSVQY